MTPASRLPPPSGSSYATPAATVGAVSVSRHEATRHHIDLGELPPGGWSTTSPPWPVRLRRPHWPQTRQLLAAAVVLLVAAPLPASAAPPGPPLVHQFTVSATSFTMDDQHLYLGDRHRSPGNQLVAHRLADGEVAWRAQVGEADASLGLTVTVDGDQLLAVSSIGDGAPDRPAEVVHTHLLDRTTGEIQWSQPGFVTDVVDGVALLRRRLDQPGPVAAPPELAPWEPPRSQLRAVDLTSGEVVWHAETLRELVAGDPASASVVAVTPEGTLVSYHLHTGAQLARGESVSPDAQNLTLQLIDGMAVLTAESDGRPVLAGYRADRLERLWTVAIPTGGYPFPCGPHLCVEDLAGSLQALALDTGEPVWNAEGRPESLPLPLWAPPSSDTHLLLRFGSSEVPGGQRLVDTRTGEAVLEVTDWQMRPDGRSGGDRPGDIWAFARPGPLDPVWVGRVTADRHRIEPLGRLRYAGECRVYSPHLACSRAGGESWGEQDVEVWRLR